MDSKSSKKPTHLSLFHSPIVGLCMARQNPQASCVFIGSKSIYKVSQLTVFASIVWKVSQPMHCNLFYFHYISRYIVVYHIIHGCVRYYPLIAVFKITVKLTFIQNSNALIIHKHAHQHTQVCIRPILNQFKHNTW